MRPLWRCRVEITLGQSDVVSIDADNLVSLREIRAVFDRVIRTAEAMNADAPTDKTEVWRPRVVND